MFVIYWILAVIITVGAVAGISKIGQRRDIYTPGQAAIIIPIQVVMILSLVYAAMKV